jgi:hypothetical protein
VWINVPFGRGSQRSKSTRRSTTNATRPRRPLGSRDHFWWPQEAITEEDVARGVAGGPADDHRARGVAVRLRHVGGRRCRSPDRALHAHPGGRLLPFVERLRLRRQVPVCMLKEDKETAPSRRYNVIILGVILLIIGFIASIPVLWTIGIILVVIGVALELLGMAGRAVGGRRHYY